MEQFAKSGYPFKQAYEQLTCSMSSPTALELKEARTKEGGGMLLGKDGKETLRNKGQKGFKADRRNTWTWRNTNRK